MSSTGANKQLWIGANSDVCARATRLSAEMLDAYKVAPALVLEHANIERATAQGGYGRRQLYELIQNGADALIGAPPGRISVVLTNTHLYCANEGAPIDFDGIEALLYSHVSHKRGTEIGRFGLGFKSVLEITRHPEFFSQSGSFVFDAVETRRQILTVAPHAEKFPVLRLAYPVEPYQAASDDPVLAELFEWATTVVRLPGGAGAAPWLSTNMSAFPGEFLIFSPHVRLLELDDRVSGMRRDIELQSRDRALELSEAGRTSEWRLFERVHTPSDAAREDAGELAERATIPLMWAVQTGGRREDGRFWAFFPTEYRKTLSGILNAPWKTNEDRQNLLAGTFNEELIDVAAEIVAEAIPDLFDPDDPGHYLDLIPARGREARNWADEQLTTRVYEQMAERASVPDQLSEMRFADELHLHPEGIPLDSLLRWSRSAHRPVDWVHPEAARSRERRSRVERLMRLRGKSPSDAVQWLEALLQSAPDTVTASADAIRVAASLLAEAKPSLVAEARSASIVLAADGRVLSPDTEGLFLPGSHTPTSSVTVVDPRLAGDPATVAALETLGIRRVDPALELKALISGNIEHWSDIDWEEFWALARDVDVAKAASIIRSARSFRPRRPSGYGHSVCAAASDVRVRTLYGRYRAVNQVLLPGPIASVDGSRDRGVTIDLDHHRRDSELIRELGGVETPQLWDQAEAEAWFTPFRREAVKGFLAALEPGHSSPREEYLAFTSTKTVGPLQPLQELSDEGRAAFTEAVLAAAGDPPNWSLSHLSQSSYPRHQVLDPLFWMLKREGRLRTDLGILPVSDCVGPELKPYRGILPVAAVTGGQGRSLDLPGALSDLSPAHWERGLAASEHLDDDSSVGMFLAAACNHLREPSQIPSQIPCRRGSQQATLPPHEVCVATSRHEFNALIDDGVPGILVGTQQDAERLELWWGLRSAADLVRPLVVAVPASPASLLLDEYPGLRWHIDEDQRSLDLQRCSTLRMEFLTGSGRSQVSETVILDAGTLYVADSLDEEATLGRVSEGLRLGLTPEEITEILASRRQKRLSDRRVQARQEKSDASRLLAVVGPDAIRRELPSALLDSVEDMRGELTDAQVGQVALAMFGTDALRHFRDALVERDFDPPTQWAGSRAAVQFVLELGFSREFAGLGSPGREPTLEVDGPLALPELHPFQRVIADRIHELVEAPPGERRALLSLPTGAGKTRIAVQALVEAVRDRGFRGPLLWVADRDELCEQAVQSWIDVWRSIGPPDRLHVSRFWSSNETAPIDDGIHVIVATIQKLRGALEDPAYAWLADVSCLVIDEAHGSIGPGHTDLLSRVGLGRSQRQDESTLLGLTATPFRGVSEVETNRLAARYGRTRLDAGTLGENPERYLQEMGVLAQVDHRVLHGDDIELSAAQLDELTRLRRLPAAIEARLGTSVKRNKVLLDSVLGLPPDWPVLFFATSVAHAQTMAALLSLEGIPAAAVSSETPPAARRSYIERFRRGELRVLTNYNVLTQGFDAPAVRALYIARPTYSPNVYQQMIGRGLRGPLNGGKENCLVVNVEDNVQQYGERLAFHHFDYLWETARVADDAGE